MSAFSKSCTDHAVALNRVVATGVATGVSLIRVVATGVATGAATGSGSHAVGGVANYVGTQQLSRMTDLRNFQEPNTK